MPDRDLLLQTINLKTYFYVHEGTVKAVDGVTFDVERSSTIGVVGESGCGKSVTARSIMRILDRGGRIVDGQILFHRTTHSEGNSSLEGIIDLAQVDPNGAEIRDIRGREIAMIFQEPMTSFSPVHTVGFQITEAIMLHQHVGKREAQDLAIGLLGRVGIPSPEQRMQSYPFQLSGGMCQRAMIAMALSCQPSLLIADEPTTALDVTTQAQILDLMRELQGELGMAIMLITHNLGVVAEMCDQVVVMYLGTVVEQAPVDDIFHDPQHPYTQCLLRSVPKLGPKTGEKLATVKGSVPSPFNRPDGCLFHPRCPSFMAGVCDVQLPQLVPVGEGRRVRCLLYNGG